MRALKIFVGRFKAQQKQLGNYLAINVKPASNLVC